MTDVEIFNGYLEKWWQVTFLHHIFNLKLNPSHLFLHEHMNGAQKQFLVDFPHY